MLQKVKGVIRSFRQYRLVLLKKSGLRVGSNFNAQPGYFLDMSHCWHIEIGDNVTFGPNVCVLAHDASTKHFLGYTRIGKVRIGDNVFVGANSTVLPGVCIGDNVIVGAGSVVTKDVPSNAVVAGAPAKVVTDLESFLARRRREMAQCPQFGEEYTEGGAVSAEMKQDMNRQMVNRIGYII